MRAILALDAALAGCSAGVVADGRLLSARFDKAGQAAALATMLQATLREAAVELTAVAVTVGPGSFTGLRASLALAHGVGLASGIPVLGVSVGAAMAHLAPSGRAFWAAIDNKRGRVFLEREGEARSLGLDELPAPEGKVAVGGDAAIAVASRLAARGYDVQLLDVRAPDPVGIALAATIGRPLPAQPLYVDPPAVRPGPAGRPAPA